MKLTVLRGISGSGKTTWAKAAKGAFIVSTDDYFYVDGEYHFDASLLQKYHIRSFYEFMQAILRQEAWVIVDNTNISAWEYSPYILAGEAFGYEVELLTLDCSVECARLRKQLVSSNLLERKAKALIQETKNMPWRFNSIHRTIKTENC